MRTPCLGSCTRQLERNWGFVVRAHSPHHRALHVFIVSATEAFCSHPLKFAPLFFVSLPVLVASIPCHLTRSASLFPALCSLLVFVVANPVAMFFRPVRAPLAISRLLCFNDFLLSYPRGSSHVPFPILSPVRHTLARTTLPLSPRFRVVCSEFGVLPARSRSF